MFTLEQAATVGCMRASVNELLDIGLVESSGVGDGVFRVPAGARHPFPRTYARWLYLQPHIPAQQRQLPQSGVLSHATAARLYGVIGDLPGPSLELIVSPDVALPASASDVRVHTETLAEDQWQWLHGLPVTRPARTLADLATSSGVDIADLGRVASRFLAERRATRNELTAALARYLHEQDQLVEAQAWLDELLAAGADDAIAL